MDKSPDAYRTISEVAEDLDLPQHVLRFWETRFAQIKPLKRGGGRRYYRPDDIDLVKGIKNLLYGTGFTIKGVQRILKDQGVKHVQSIGRTGQAPDSASTTSSAPAIEEQILASPLLARTEPLAPAVNAIARPVTPGSAEDLASLIAPSMGMRPASRTQKRKVPQLGLFGDDDSEAGALSPQAMARMLPSAWQGASAMSGQSSAKLEAALAELEECNRLIVTAKMVSAGEEA